MAVGGDAPTKNINPYRLATEAEYHLFRPEWVGKNDDWVTADGGDQCAANDVNAQVRRVRSQTHNSFTWLLLRGGEYIFSIYSTY